jgi:hypothetical protein
LCAYAQHLLLVRLAVLANGAHCHPLLLLLLLTLTLMPLVLVMQRAGGLCAVNCWCCLHPAC